jgi:hypothetical protein
MTGLASLASTRIATFVPPSPGLPVANISSSWMAVHARGHATLAFLIRVRLIIAVHTSQLATRTTPRIHQPSKVHRSQQHRKHVRRLKDMKNSTYLDELVPWQQGPTERGGYGIIFSCLAVVITSTWTVLHLNLPGPRKRDTPIILGEWGPEISSMTVRKMKWTLIMIIFPELVFAYAILELRMALDDFIKWSNSTKRCIERVGVSRPIDGLP